jgi:hypothetical protein
MKDGSTTGKVLQILCYRVVTVRVDRGTSECTCFRAGRVFESLYHASGWVSRACEGFISHVVLSSQQYYLFLSLAELLVRVDPLSETFTSSSTGAAT